MNTKKRMRVSGPLAIVFVALCSCGILLFFLQVCDKPIEEISGDYQFRLNRDNTLTITKYLGSEKFVEIPAEIAGKAVTIIGNTSGEGAFQGCSEIRSVTIPEGVTEIQSKPFYNCTNLAVIYIPASVQRLDDHAFVGSCSLRSVYFEGDAPETGQEVFTPTFTLKIYHYESAAGWTNPWNGYSSEVYGDYLYKENGDGTLTIIGYQGNGSMEIPLFADCPNLKRIYFEGNASYTNKQAFETAQQTTVYFHDTATGWTNPWNGLLAKPYGDYQYETADNGTVKVTKYVGVGGDVQIPSEIDGKAVTVIGVNSFLDCTSITGITIPEGVEVIADNAFYGCCNLKTAVIPASVTIIGHCAFSGCCNLQSVCFEGDAPHMGHYIFDDFQPVFYYYEDKEGWTNPWYGRSALKRTVV